MGAVVPVFVTAAPACVRERLAGATVHVWRVPYARAAGRAPLLRVLAAYLGVPTDGVALGEGPHGKPHLAGYGRDSRERLEFNWSHSGGHALVALSRGQPIGVDIERMSRDVRAGEIAARFFDPLESAALRARLESGDDRAFTSLWCAKEAVLKATGEGIAFGLDRIAFDWRADGWSLARADAALGPAGAWQLATFDAAPDFRGALAWRGGPRTVAWFAAPDALAPGGPRG